MKKKRTILFMIAMSAVLGVFFAFFLNNPLVYSNNLDRQIDTGFRSDQ